MNYNGLLTAAIMAYDRQEEAKAKKKGIYHSIYGMPLLLGRVHEVVADIERGADVRRAILAGFNGRTADMALKAVGLPRATQDEKRGGMGGYRPITEIED